jgi:hypothetical protein
VLSLHCKAGIEPAAAQARSGRLGQPPDAAAAQLSNGSGGGNGSGPGSMDSVQGQKQGHEGRSEEELIAAADWQLQRAHAQLRRAAEAEVRVCSAPTCDSHRQSRALEAVKVLHLPLQLSVNIVFVCSVAGKAREAAPRKRRGTIEFVACRGGLAACRGGPPASLWCRRQRRAQQR